LADYDLDELRALKRSADDAVARAEAAVAELRSINAVMGSAINRLLDKAQAQGGSRERVGERQTQIVKVIQEAGGGPGADWIHFDVISAKLSDAKSNEIMRSLRAGREWLWEQSGDTYRLLPRGS
jgi:hypothetical protein